MNVRLVAFSCPTSALLLFSGQVEEHPAFGRGVVRAARVTKILHDSSWDWSGLLLLYALVALVGIAAVVVLNTTDADYGFRDVKQWVLVVLGLPGVAALLAFLFQVPKANYLYAAPLNEQKRAT